jgi:hypothetical protein
VGSEIEFPISGKEDTLLDSLRMCLAWTGTPVSGGKEGTDIVVMDGEAGETEPWTATLEALGRTKCSGSPCPRIE